MSKAGNWSPQPCLLAEGWLPPQRAAAGQSVQSTSLLMMEHLIVLGVHILATVYSKVTPPPPPLPPFHLDSYCRIHSRLDDNPDAALIVSPAQHPVRRCVSEKKIGGLGDLPCHVSKRRKHQVQKPDVHAPAPRTSASGGKSGRAPNRSGSHPRMLTNSLAADISKTPNPDAAKRAGALRTQAGTLWSVEKRRKTPPQAGFLAAVALGWTRVQDPQAGSAWAATAGAFPRGSLRGSASGYGCPPFLRSFDWLM